MTKQEREARALIEAWLKKNKIKHVGGLRHVQPRVYVVGYAASGCLIVAEPWMDSEPQVKDWNEKYPLTIVRKFDQSLKAGDWCATAYYSTISLGETVAVGWTKK